MCWFRGHRLRTPAPSSTLNNFAFPPSSFQILSTIHWKEVTLDTLTPLCAQCLILKLQGVIRQLLTTLRGHFVEWLRMHRV